jgi:hypothetical protein
MDGNNVCLGVLPWVNICQLEKFTGLIVTRACAVRVNGISGVTALSSVLAPCPESLCSQAPVADTPAHECSSGFVDAACGGPSVAVYLLV